MNRSTTKASTGRVDPSGNGQQSESPFRLEAPRRKVEIPQLLIAVFMVAVSALVAVVLFSQAAAREPALALAQSVERGEAVTSGDLMVVYVATDDPVSSLPPDAAAGLVGLTAVADLEPGTLLTSAHLVSRSLLDAGEGVVGMALAPGEYPTLLLTPGDRVDVVLTSRTPSEEGVTDIEAVATSAEVFDVAELGTQGDRFISLLLPADDAAKVAGAAAAGRVRLVLVSGVDQ
ncbi:MAG: SAF domain-containing protein [Acidimicrobiia bacterium]|nr:SAF domain-containing protein [Acidimicrobiia bacterium]